MNKNKSHLTIPSITNYSINSYFIAEKLDNNHFKMNN